MNPLNNEDKDKNLISDDSAIISERDDFQDNVKEEHHHSHHRRSSLYIAESKSYDIATGMSKRSHGSRSSSSKKKKKKKNAKQIILIVASSVLGLLAVLSAVVAILYNLGYADLTEKSGMNLAPPKGVDVVNKGSYIKYRGNSYKYRDTMTSVLFMGIDKKEKLGTDDGVVGTGGQADALYLVAVDTASGSTTTFQVSRSAMCDVDIYSATGEFIATKKEQVCLSYAYGDGLETSAENCIKSMRRIFYGLPIAQTYLSMDIDGISAINDSIGGVTVVSPVTYEKYKKGKTYELHGKEAEDFVRLRSHTQVSGNSNRMERQKAYLDSFVKKAVDMTRENISTPVDIYNGADAYTFSNFTAAKVSYLALSLINKGVENADIQKVPSTDKKGKLFVESYINDEKFFEMIVNTFYEVCDDRELSAATKMTDADESLFDSIVIPIVGIILALVLVLTVIIIFLKKKLR